MNTHTVPDTTPKKKWKVSGYALAPILIEMEIECATERSSIQIAQSRFKNNKSAYTFQNNVDMSQAYDWQPTAEEEL